MGLGVFTICYSRVQVWAPPPQASLRPGQNGASELIDLIARCGTKVGGFKNGPWQTQYKEYERSAAACGYKILRKDDPTPDRAGPDQMGSNG